MSSALATVHPSLESESAGLQAEMWKGSFNHCLGHYRDRRATAGAKTHVCFFLSLAFCTAHSNSDRTVSEMPRCLGGCIGAISTNVVSRRQCEIITVPLLGNLWQARPHLED
uniref:Uncharacterized protein n=1 Tax=Anguilla anguilla TaxID=7936 RepID=A0A0E9T2D9_ANGAN